MSCVLFICVCVLICAYKLYNRYRDRQTISGIPGRYVVITGCDSGFGHELVIRLDEMGMHVIAGCLTEKGREALKKKSSSRLVTILLDVGSVESISEAVKVVQNILPKGKGLWGLVNNAGIVGELGVCEWLKKEDYVKTFDVNLLGAIETTRQFLPFLRQARGRVVNMSSIAGSTISPIYLPYCISKHGVEVFSSCLRLEAKKLGISVHMIKPSLFRTNVALHEPKANNLTSRFERLDSDVKAFYGKTFLHKLIQYMKDYAPESSAKLHLVVDAYTHALTASRPHFRYRVGPMASTLFRLMEYTPIQGYEYFGEHVIPTPEGSEYRMGR